MNKLSSAKIFFFSPGNERYLCSIDREARRLYPDYDNVSKRETPGEVRIDSGNTDIVKATANLKSQIEKIKRQNLKQEASRERRVESRNATQVKLLLV